MPLTFERISIESDAWVAAHAFIMPGVLVGRGAVVGACSVVPQDVQPWTVVAGHPATIICSRPSTSSPFAD
jgi:putative colanic acid biosynthesis acetyltransferase WcaF